MKRIIIFAIGFLFVLVTSGFAMHHGGGMKGGGMQHGNKWWQKLHFFRDTFHPG